jgi:hypothetical protein
MGPIRLIAAPIRGIARSRLFQLAAVLTIILLLDHYSFDYAPLKKVSDGLKWLVDATEKFCSELFRVGILTDPVLQVGLMIAYVYVVCLIIVYLLRLAFRYTVDFIGWSNLFWLRNTIARERGIAAYQAWVPLERIRPDDVPQERWEQTFAWPADNKPPYPPLTQRIAYSVISYIVVLGGAAALLQAFTPFPVLTWLGKLTAMVTG